jgi:hypothetical protein
MTQMLSLNGPDEGKKSGLVAGRSSAGNGHAPEPGPNVRGAGIDRKHFLQASAQTKGSMSI